MLRDEDGRPRSMFKTLRKLHGQNLDSTGLNDLTDKFATFMTRARFFSIGHLRRTWSHSAVEFMKYRRRLPALVAPNDTEGDSDSEFGDTSRLEEDEISERELSVEAEDETAGFNSARFLTTQSFRQPKGAKGGVARSGSNTSSGSSSGKGKELDPRKIFISNLSYRVTTCQLASFFAKFGKVANCSIPMEKTSYPVITSGFGTLPKSRQRSRGFAFITFRSVDSAEKAKAAVPEDLKLYDRIMSVSQALPTPRKRMSTSAIPHSSSIGTSAPLASLAASGGEDESLVSEPDSNPTSPSVGHDDLHHINSLSDSVLGRIFTLLEYRQRIRIERVCKKWLELSIQSWSHQQELRLTATQFSEAGNRKPLQNISLRAILHRCGRHLRFVDLSGSPQFLDDQSLQLLTRYCTNLLEVDLTGLKVSWKGIKQFAETTPRLQAIAYRDAVGHGEKAFWYLFRNCNNLHRVDLSGCSRLLGRCFRFMGLFLEELVLDGCVRLEGEAVEEICLKSINLRLLRLNACQKLSDETINMITRCLGSLQVISLCGNVFPDLTPSGLVNLGLMDSLIEIELASNRSVNDSVVSSIANGCPSLKKLNLADAGSEDQITETGLLSLANCEHLEVLDLSFLSCVRDSVVKAVGTRNILKVLKLRSCVYVGDTGISMLLGCKHLLDLDLSGCFRVSNTSVQKIISNFKTSGRSPTKPESCLSIVLGGTNCYIRSLKTAGTTVILDGSDNSKSYVYPGVAQLLSGEEEGAGYSDDDVEDDEFESLTASRSFVLESLDEDDFVLDESKAKEWAASLVNVASSTV